MFLFLPYEINIAAAVYCMCAFQHIPAFRLNNIRNQIIGKEYIYQSTDCRKYDYEAQKFLKQTPTPNIYDYIYIICRFT
jgi:hypothetical protein